MKKGKSKWIIPAVILVLIFIAANSFLVVTYPNEYTVIKQFGKIVDPADTGLKHEDSCDPDCGKDRK